MDCVALHRQGPPGELAATVEALTDSVVVMVPDEDRPQARRELPGRLLLPLDLRGRTLAQAADGVFPVPGRCVVLADAWEGGWDLVVTTGAVPQPVAAVVAWPRTSEPAVPAPTPVDPRRLDTAWLGAGAYVGVPDLFGVFATGRLGPVVGEVGVLPLLLVNIGYARLGLMAPVGGWGESTFSVGALAGAQGFYFVSVIQPLEEGYDGVDWVAAVDWRLQDGPKDCVLVRLEVGAGRYDRALVGRRWLPTAEISLGAEFGASLASPSDRGPE